MWTLNSEYNPDIKDEQGRVVCSLHGYGTTEGRRNARMILAASEMYELLKDMCAFCDSFVFGGDKKRAEKILRKIDKED